MIGRLRASRSRRYNASGIVRLGPFEPACIVVSSPTEPDRGSRERQTDSASSVARATSAPPRGSSLYHSSSSSTTFAYAAARATIVVGRSPSRARTSGTRRSRLGGTRCGSPRSARRARPRPSCARQLLAWCARMDASCSRRRRARLRLSPLSKQSHRDRARVAKHSPIEARWGDDRARWSHPRSIGPPRRGRACITFGSRTATTRTARIS